MLGKIIIKLKCLIGDHQWTSAAEEGIDATKAQREGGIEGFYDYARMYCKQCGKVYVSPYDK